MKDKDIIKELSNISVLNGLGFLGIFLPFIGLIAYGISVSKSNTLLNTLDETMLKKYKKEISRRKSTALSMFTLVVLIVLLWVVTFVSINNQQSSSVSPDTPAVSNSVDEEQDDESSIRQEALNTCIDSINNWYNENIQTATTVYQEQNLLTQKQQGMDECRLRYPVE